MKSYVSQISSYTSIVDGGSKQKHIHLVTENFSRAYDATQKECDIALKLSLDFDKWKIWTFRSDCILQLREASMRMHVRLEDGPGACFVIGPAYGLASAISALM
jgi:hypothetical protein